ncbi:hypothetical protein [Inconstantimicrobium mannanitabidum]|uniref:Uncharacterized protein n=1 Tax=Inconstantimicrobium mannanitabidum TaxID=1604901 RepID=A0ACB5R956_9CLOT|nr:hypothetical protein [Clostridium sp. TW13]GKX65635.1 hypothetical protein rsdtw13_08930 [Clostridium sp. TW13]
MFILELILLFISVLVIITMTKELIKSYDATERASYCVAIAIFLMVLAEQILLLSK